MPLLLICILLVFSFSSCFQIIEEINVKANGSGKAVITLNLSASKSKVASIMLMDSINGYDVPSEAKINKELNEAVAFLCKVKGISDVKKTTDFNNYIATISFSFQNVSNINNLTQAILQKQKVKSTNFSSYTYSAANKQFKRIYKYAPDARKQYEALKSKDKEVFKTAIFTSIYRFDFPIVSSANSKAKISKSKKAVMLQKPVIDLINGSANISNTLQLGK